MAHISRGLGASVAAFKVRSEGHSDDRWSLQVGNLPGACFPFGFQFTVFGFRDPNKGI